ncbi:acyl-CoA thioesterase [Mucilaginibacter sp. BJC16-A38]|uniref:acyl-CoA thioesterase n=1 Tax=Mucilaginibacter phenanthrenivorans TaxID=1234842 RepID=UPI0021586637|nr:thioesterase family protein [Mucilaginibacter phenanthrenivorans]MCR8556300.1 acyl-CoA thioesterase [Mucilaginibacter phenanthrenivorans]
MSEKIADYKYKTPIAIRFSDIDAVGHVNNAIYLTYFEVARFNYWKEAINWNLRENGVIVGRSEVNYLKPITLEDEIFCYVRTTRIGNSSFDIMHLLVRITPHGEEICTTGKTVCISYDYSLNKSISIPQKERDMMIAYDEPGLILNTN